MNQTEKVAKWLADIEAHMVDYKIMTGEDEDAILAIRSLLQRAEPVGATWNKSGDVNWVGTPPPALSKLYLHPPASREVGDFEPWMVEFLEGNLYALPPSIRTKDARERWREVANARIAAAISRLFEEVESED